MLCAAVDNRDSFDRLNDFKNEIKTENPGALIVLVATKTDLRAVAEGCLTDEDFEAKR